MADSFAGVSVTFDKTSYNTGDTITMTLAGEDVLTTTTTVAQALTGTINLVAADGATTSIAFPTGSTVNVTTTVATNESTKIASVADTENAARVWTPAANGLTATAIA